MPEDFEASKDHGHIPVLLDRCVELLRPALTRQSPDGSGAVLVDATLGAGGHAERFLTEFGGLRLIGLDRDPDALWIAGERLSGSATASCWSAPVTTASRTSLPKPITGQATTAVFKASCSTSACRRCNWTEPSAGSPTPRTRRWTCAWIATLTLTAAEVVNTYDEKTLARVLREFGDERFAGRIAAQIIRRRARRPFSTTAELVELLYQAIPAPARRTGGHPAKRTFQALRIAVNGELDSLRDALPAALGALAPGGRIVVMAYQSLEDRIVKTQFAKATASRTPPGLPVELAGHEPEFVALTRGAERAGAEEIADNPRSTSVRLRAVEKVGGER